MTSNLQALATLNQQIIAIELAEKTKRGGFIWNQVSPSRFYATQGNYGFYVSKVNSDTYALDVTKNNRPFRSYLSNRLSEIEDTFNIVDLLYGTDNKYAKMLRLSLALEGLEASAPGVNFISVSGGLKAGGTASLAVQDAIEVTLRPNRLTFGPSPFPWVGTYTRIDDFPNAAAHNGDVDYIRQQVSGEYPTNWGYANVGFPINTVALDAVKAIGVRVAHRREANEGVNLVVDIVLNSTVVFSQQVVSGSAYSVFNSGIVDLPEVTSVDSVEVRLSMFTNTGNNDPRVLRITAVDLRFLAYA